MRRRLPAAVVALILGACAFPDVSYTNDSTPDAPSAPESSLGDDAPAIGEGGMDSEAGDVAPGKDATTDGPDKETSTVDAPPPADAYDVFEAAPDAPPCDQDQDGFMAIGGTCGGQDCDDDDPRAYPGEPNYLTALPRATTMYGDWNCNHVVEKLYPTKVDCTTSIANCDSVSGFTGDPGCGTPSTFVQCMTMNVVFCVVGASSMQVQACR
jgi:hypothetical protein